MVEFFGTLIVVIIAAFIILALAAAAFFLIVLPVFAIIVGAFVSVASLFQKDQ